MKLKQIGVMSAAKICATFYALMMAIVGLFYLGFFVIISSLMALGSGANMGKGAALLGLGFGAFGIVFGILIYIGIIILYAIFGFIFGALSAFLYNKIAEKVGPLEVDLGE
jgi:hypothetical protein